jgi:hypothetical protein
VFDVAHNTKSSSNTDQGKGWSLTNNTSGPPVGTNNLQGDGTGRSDTITGTQLSVGGNASLPTTTGDIALTGSNIVATGDVTLHAARDLTIASGQDSVGNANQSDSKAIGTVVISDTERFSGWHGFAEAIFAEAVARGLLERAPHVAAITTAGYPTPARRPAYSCLDNSRFQQDFGFVLPLWEMGLSQVVASLPR